MREEGMDGVATFMHHGGDITHLACSIHEYKWRSRFRQRAIVTAWCLSFPAVQVQSSHLFHLGKTFSEKGMHLVEAGYGFIYQLFSIYKRCQGLYTLRFCIGIPWT